MGFRRFGNSKSFFAVAVFNAPVSSPKAIQVFLFSIAHAGQVPFKIGLREEKTRTVWTFEVFRRRVLSHFSSSPYCVSEGLCKLSYRPAPSHASLPQVHRESHANVLFEPEPAPPSLRDKAQ